VERFKYKIPAELKEKNKFFKAWKPPKDHPTKTGPSTSGEEESDKKGGKEEEEEEEEKEEVDDGTPEEEVPIGLEMWGMSVSLAGTKKELGMSQDDLVDLISQHGGVVYDDAEDVSFLVAPENEITKKKKLKKFLQF